MEKLLIFLLVLLTTAHGWAQRAYDTVFILQDAGETEALLPVIEKCAQNNEIFLILTGGQATEILSKKIALKDKIISYTQLGISEVIDKTWKQDAKISDSSLKKIEAEIETKQVVSGVAFELQGQLLESFKKRKCKTFAYWDNINYEGTHPYFQTAAKVAKIADRLLVPSKTFINAYPQGEVVGQPFYELWKQQISGIRPTSVTAKLPFTIKTPVIVFIGGYGRDYEEALREFLGYAQDLKRYTVLLSYHPKMEGKVEKEELQKQPISHVHLLQSSWNISSCEAIAIADYVICHQSMMGINAAVAGKKVIYLVSSGQTYTNLLIERGAARTVSTFDELLSTLTSKKSVEDPFAILKVPQGSVDLIYNRIKMQNERR
jgi:hypothetical protein